jgi:prepilin-type N-terminal cleavage/methylation domain-containing protein
MKMKKSKRGFSLAEVLMAVGILALGMAFIAGVFPAGLHYTIISTERTMAAVVADEAFAKIRLYGVDVNLPPLPLDVCEDFSKVSIGAPVRPAADEFGYPSVTNIALEYKNYFWSALCRRVLPVSSRRGETLVQVTVFVSRKFGAGVKYNDINGGTSGLWPVPVKVSISNVVGNKFNIPVLQRTFIGAGSIIVDNSSGRIYRVLGQDPANPGQIILDVAWQGPPTGDVWVVPPPIGGGRYPCVGVFQKEMLF